MVASVVKEAEEKLLVPSQPCKAMISHGAQFLHRDRSGIAHALLDVAVAELFRIKIRSIRWKPLHLNLGMLGQEGFDHGCSMSIEPVPDQDQGTRNVPQQMAQEEDHVLTVDGVLEVALEDAAREGHAGNRGEFTALAHPPQHGRMALRRPCGAGTLQEGEARFVNEDDLRRPAASLFLILGQSPRSHSLASSSSRSLALTAGCCTLQPEFLSFSAM